MESKFRVLEAQREFEKALTLSKGTSAEKLHEYTHHAWSWGKNDDPHMVCQACGMLRSEFNVAAVSMRDYTDLPPCGGVQIGKANALVDALLMRGNP